MKNILQRFLPCLLFVMALTPIQAWALGAEGIPEKSSISNPLAITLVAIIVVLLLIIVFLARIVRDGMDVYKHNNAAKKAGNAAIATVVGISLLLMSGSTAYAQDAATAEVAKTASSISGLSPTSFYLMLAVIGAEALVIFALMYNLRVLLGLERKRRAGVENAENVKGAASLSWWEKFNSFKPINEEASIELDHEYDGIRELDNRLPPWWLYGFYLTIIFAGFYLYHYHISHSGPLSGEEYAISMKEAEAQKAAYLKKSANNIDELSVKLLTDAADINAGKTIFTSVCKTCHGEHGEGGIGPNLTDDYWIHGGSINNIFKTIKYGVDGKGMQSWESTYSPLQIAQMASYIKSIHGTKPANAKAPQGDLYTDRTAPAKADSSKAKADSTHK